MGPIVVIGDELQVAGFRLAGIEVHSPAPEDLVAAFERATESAALVVLSRHCAESMPAQLLREALRREMPPVVVMPDIADPDADDGVVRRMRTLLGIEA